MKRLSLYRNSENVTFSRRVIIFLFDYIVLLFITMFLFLIIDSLSLNNNSSKIYKLNEETQYYQAELIKIMEDANLGYGDDNSIYDSSIISDKFIYTLVYKSLDENVIDKDAYSNKLLKNNPIEYYYDTYKVQNSSNYDNYSLDEVGSLYANNLLLSKVNINSVILYVNNDEIFIHEKYAKAVDNLISSENENTDYNGEIISGTDCYSILYKAFNDLLQNAKEDLMSNNTLYLKSFDNFNSIRNEMIGYKIFEIIICFSLISIIYFVLVPLLNMNNSTLSMMLFHMIPCSIDGYKISKISIFIKFILEYIMYINVIAIIVTFLYNTNSIVFLKYRIANIVSVTDIYIFSTLILIISFVMSSMKSMKFQTLSDKISKQYVKDARE